MERADELRRLAATPGIPEALATFLLDQARLAEPRWGLTEKARSHLARKRTPTGAAAG